jgi:hypothetical protein
MIAVTLSYVPLLYALLLLSVAAYILRYGGPAERACILTIAVGSVATLVAANQQVWSNAESGIFAVDLVTLLAFIAIMGRSNRFWPLWITALQIVAVMTHVARFVKPQTVPMAYAIAEQLWAYVMMGILIICVHQHHRRPR